MSKNSQRMSKPAESQKMFSMETSNTGKPDELIFPYNNIELSSEINKGISGERTQDIVYPDFSLWRDVKSQELAVEKSRRDKLNDALYLNKGYFEASHVSNEYHSARNYVHSGLDSSDISSEILEELSEHITGSYRRRNFINKLGHYDGFRLPPRVTLTAMKREAWLNDLANPTIELEKIGNKIPYGIKNKSLVDVLCNKRVPMNRALWFTKCVMLNEMNALKKKQSSFKQSPSSQMEVSSELLEHHWLQEWTQQLVDYIYKFSKEMSTVFSAEKKQQYMKKLSYLLNYIRTLYIEDLIYKEIFLSSCVNYLKECLPTNSLSVIELLKLSVVERENEFFEKWFSENEIILDVKLVILTIVKIFWEEIIHLDYLSKDLSEQLLLNYYFIEKIPSTGKPAKTIGSNKILNTSLKANLLNIISESIKFLFKYNTFVFIVPNYWLLVKECLYNVLLDDLTISDHEARETKKQLNLIKYRNESMLLNMNQVPNTASDFSVSRKSTNRNTHVGSDSLLSKSRFNPSTSSLSVFGLGDDNYLFTRNETDILNIIDQLDRICLKDWLADLVRPSPSTNSDENMSEENGSWKIFLKLMIYWAVTEQRCSIASGDGILIICNFLKKVERNFLSSKSPRNTKNIYENEVLEIVYDLGCLRDFSFDKQKLYVLINELYQLKVITLSAYLRKLIASGIFFLPENESMPPSEEQEKVSVRTHLEILQNLPVINNRQCDSILAKWSEPGINFKERFEKGKNILSQELLDQISNSKSDIRFDNVMNFFKDLQVGLRFLLINWFTNQFKYRISESAKLIHFSPGLMTKIYHFFSANDNLTVFFKVILRFILNNETKMIIYYLDTLYLISRLIIKHFRLIKMIDNNNESNSISYELFTLVVISYKDLLTRDINCFDFERVWDFINGIIKKDDSGGDNKVINKLEIPLKPKSMLNSPLKEIGDSPVKINLKAFIQKPEERYSYVIFRKDLDYLLKNSYKDFSLANVQDLLSATTLNLEIGSKTEDLMKRLCKNIFSKLLNNDLEELTREAETSCLRSLKCLSVLLDRENSSMDQEFSDFIVEANNKNNGMYLIVTYIEKLLAFEVYEIRKVFDMIQKIYSPIHSGDTLSNVSLKMILGAEEEHNLPDEELFFLDLSRTYYRSNYMPELIVFILKEIAAKRIGIVGSKGVLVGEILLEGAIFFTKFFIDSLFEHLSLEETIKLLNSLLKPHNGLLWDASDLPKLAGIVNEFNLPLCQALVAALFKVPKRPENDNEDPMIESVESFLCDLRFLFVRNNSYFGELFKFIDWSYQVEILKILEKKVLLETKFVYSKGVSEDFGIHLTSKNRRINLLPILKDYFEKFSVSSKHFVVTSSNFFDELNGFAVKLLKVANADEPLHPEMHDDIYNLLGIFIRILIIHKLTLTTKILERDYSNLSLVTNLISLLNSRFLSGNKQKLKILLYDLLLLIKTSVTQELSQKSLRNFSDTSPKDSFIHSESDMEQLSRNSSVANVQQLSQSYENASDFSKNLSALLSVFKLPEPTLINLLKTYANLSGTMCHLMLDKNELRTAGDIHMINNSNFEIIYLKKKPFNFSSGYLEEKEDPHGKATLNLNSFEVLESSSYTLNQGFLNLLLFDAYLIKENPP